MFDHFEPYAVLLSSLRCVLSCVSLVDIGQLHHVARDLLHLLSQDLYLATVASIGRSHGQRDQVAQRIDGDVQLGTLAPLGPVLGGADSALRRGLQCAAVDADRRWLTLTTAELPQ